MTSNENGQTERRWRERAACRGMDGELFFPVAESGPVRTAQVAAAKAVCARCPVREECLVEALARIPYGIAGGLTENERRTLRRTASPGTGAREVAAWTEVDVELLPGPNARERARFGRQLLTRGRTTSQVARACGVSTRTVQRWAGGGEHGGHRAPLRISTAHQQPGRHTSTGRRPSVMGIVYFGPFAAEINGGTRYGHEGYAAQVLADGTESRFRVREFREYRAGCDCGWRSTRMHPPTDAGETAAEDEWNDEHLRPLIRAVAARRAVPASAVLDLIAELRAAVAAAEDARPEGGLTERERGRCDVIEVLESRLEDLAVKRPESPRRIGGAW